jgi:hypothetical protein
MDYTDQAVAAAVAAARTEHDFGGTCQRRPAGW